MKAIEIADILAQRPWGASVPAASLRHRIAMALIGQAANGTLRRVKGRGRSVTWGIA